MRILANDGIDASAKATLESMGYEVDTTFYEGDEFVNQLNNTDVLIVRSATKVREELVNKINDKLKLVIRAGVGIDNIDVAPCNAKGITVRNTPNSSSASVAELVIGHMFSLARFIGISNYTMRNKEWNKKAYKGTEIAGKTLGLIGFGRIAKEVAIRAKALGMDVVYYDLNQDNSSDFKYMEMNELLKVSDYVSLHIPLDKNVGAVIKAEQFKMMKNSAYLIQAARGGVVCEKDLLDALNNGEIAGAGLDVFEKEPTDNHELVNHPLVSATPHIGASTSEAQKRIGEEIISVIEEEKGNM